MKKIILTLSLLALLGLSTLHAQVKVGDNPTSIDASAAFEVESTNKGLLPPRMNSAQRNDINNPAEGLTIFNTDHHCLNVFDGEGWINLCGTFATGGDVVERKLINGEYYRIHQFTSVGEDDFQVVRPGTVEYLIIAGGGGAGSGGGGAGGYIEGNENVIATSYTITVGAGGVGSSGLGIAGLNGENSSAFGETAIGGGGGGRGSTRDGGNGGSGGGGAGNSSNNGIGGLGQPGQGFDGAGNGINSSTPGRGGGGGGASQPGQRPPDADTGGDGGDGKMSSITGVDIFYAGGGAGQAEGTMGNNGNGQQNAGGGGSLRDAPFVNGRNGVVIIRYQID